MVQKIDEIYNTIVLSEEKIENIGEKYPSNSEQDNYIQFSLQYEKEILVLVEHAYSKVIDVKFSTNITPISLLDSTGSKVYVLSGNIGNTFEIKFKSANGNCAWIYRCGIK